MRPGAQIALLVVAAACGPGQSAQLGGNAFSEMSGNHRGDMVVIIGDTRFDLNNDSVIRFVLADGQKSAWVAVTQLRTTSTGACTWTGARWSGLLWADIASVDLYDRPSPVVLNAVIGSASAAGRAAGALSGPREGRGGSGGGASPSEPGGPGLAAPALDLPGHESPPDCAAGRPFFR